MTSRPPVGTCFGFALSADSPIWFLREGDGSPLAVKHEPDYSPVAGDLITEWLPTERNPVEGRLHVGGNRGSYALWIRHEGWYSIDPRRQEITTSSRYETIAGSIRLLGLPLLLCCLARGDTTLHAAAVSVNGRAILLAAPGQHGKTSLSIAFGAAGYSLLTEDLSCLRISSDGVGLIPGPSFLRIRPDMVAHLPKGAYVVEGRYGDRIAARPSLPLASASPLQVGAVVFLSGFNSQFELTTLSPTAALTDLWFLSFHLPTDADRNRKFAALVDIAKTVPILRLVRPRDRARLSETVERLVQVIQ
jgi:hypothetical protein